MDQFESTLPQNASIHDQMVFQDFEIKMTTHFLKEDAASLF